MPVEELQYFIRIFKATSCSPISWRASMTAFHVGSLEFLSHLPNISCLQRRLSPGWSFSIVQRWWLSNPNFIPSECQSWTKESSFESSRKVGVAGAVGGDEWFICTYMHDISVFVHAHKCGTKLTLHPTLPRVRSFCHVFFCSVPNTHKVASCSYNERAFNHRET